MARGLSRRLWVPKGGGYTMCLTGATAKLHQVSLCVISVTNARQIQWSLSGEYLC